MKSFLLIPGNQWTAHVFSGVSHDLASGLELLADRYDALGREGMELLSLKELTDLGAILCGVELTLDEIRNLDCWVRDSGRKSAKLLKKVDQFSYLQRLSIIAALDYMQRGLRTKPGSRSRSIIEGFRELKAGWCYGEGVAFDEKMLGLALAFDRFVAAKGFAATAAFPGTEGEIMYTVHWDEHYLEFTINPPDGL